uniref:WW domain-containing protein n=1 Tax=Rhizochromulina marina TaxID=1034831 RepID=A0A7S2RIQ9_9STRA
MAALVPPPARPRPSRLQATAMSRTRAERDGSVPRIKGRLSKRQHGLLKGGWKQRYCTLEGNVLSWYDNEDAPAPLGSLDVTGAKVDGEAMRCGGGDAQGPEKHMVISIEPRQEVGRPLELKAETVSEARRWIVVLQGVARGSRARQSSSSSIPAELQKDPSRTSSSSTAPADAAEDNPATRGIRKGSPWRRVETGNGKAYFYHSVTKETTWRLPTEEADLRESEQARTTQSRDESKLVPSGKPAKKDSSAKDAGALGDEENERVGSRSGTEETVESEDAPSVAGAPAQVSHRGSADGPSQSTVLAKSVSWQSVKDPDTGRELSFSARPSTGTRFEPPPLTTLPRKPALKTHSSFTMGSSSAGPSPPTLRHAHSESLPPSSAAAVERTKAPPVTLAPHPTVSSSPATPKLSSLFPTMRQSVPEEQEEDDGEEGAAPSSVPSPADGLVAPANSLASVASLSGLPSTSHHRSSSLEACRSSAAPSLSEPATSAPAQCDPRRLSARDVLGVLRFSHSLTANDAGIRPEDAAIREMFVELCEKQGSGSRSMGGAEEGGGAPLLLEFASFLLWDEIAEAKHLSGVGIPALMSLWLTALDNHKQSSYADGPFRPLTETEANGQDCSEDSDEDDGPGGDPPAMEEHEFVHFTHLLYKFSLEEPGKDDDVASYPDPVAAPPKTPPVSRGRMSVEAASGAEEIATVDDAEEALHIVASVKAHVRKSMLESNASDAELDAKRASMLTHSRSSTARVSLLDDGAPALTVPEAIRMAQFVRDLEQTAGHAHMRLSQQCAPLAASTLAELEGEAPAAQGSAGTGSSDYEPPKFQEEDVKDEDFIVTFFAEISAFFGGRTEPPKEDELAQAAADDAGETRLSAPLDLEVADGPFSWFAARFLR